MFNYFKLYKLPICIVGFFLYSVLMVFGGWKVHEYYTGYQNDINSKIELIVKNGISQYQREQAQGLEDQKGILSNIKTNTILKEQTILKQPIYLQQCLDQAGVDLLKEYRQQSADIINGKKNE